MTALRSNAAPLPPRPSAVRHLLLGVLLLAASCSEGPTTPAHQLPEAAAFVTNFSGNNVSVFDVSTRVVAGSIPVGYRPVDVAVTPDGSKVLVVSMGAGGTAGGSVSVIDGTSGKVTATIGTGVYPSAVAITPDGKKAYVPNESRLDFDVPQYNRVMVIDVASERPLRRILIGGADSEAWPSPPTVRRRTWPREGAPS